MGAKTPPTGFSHITSPNVGNDPQNFLTFIFNPFATMLENVKTVPSITSKLLN